MLTMLFFALLLLGSGLLLLFICTASYLIKRKQRQALRFLPSELLPREIAEAEKAAKVNILAFSTVACRQCRLLQTPVLQRIKEMHGDKVMIVDVQANPELVERFQVDAFPTTALFDAEGKLYAINYGFANAQCLVRQVEELLQALQVSERN